MNKISPGEELKNLLMKFHPKTHSTNFVKQLDYCLAADGELEQLIYLSSINYLIRRFINTSQYIYQEYGEYSFRSELQQYLRDHTRYTDRQRTDIAYALEKCLKYMQETESATGDMNSRRNEAKRFNFNCYICGTTLDFGGSDPDKIATADHIWPRSMGGLNEKENIKVACGKCNNKLKRNRLDYSDYHYESISLSSNEGSANFLTELESQYRIAVYTKSQFSCESCGQPAYRVGKLLVGRRDTSDSWHFLNMVAYCANCASEV
ncbi:MAG: hypothetical protein OHK0022_02980 [Roseiflexaceae bacterium]